MTLVGAAACEQDAAIFLTAAARGKRPERVWKAAARLSARWLTGDTYAGWAVRAWLRRERRR
jgi:hypothetical protein